MFLFIYIKKNEKEIRSKSEKAMLKLLEETC